MGQASRAYLCSKLLSGDVVWLLLPSLLKKLAAGGLGTEPGPILSRRGTSDEDGSWRGNTWAVQTAPESRGEPPFGGQQGENQHKGKDKSGSLVFDAQTSPETRARPPGTKAGVASATLPLVWAIDPAAPQGGETGQKEPQNCDGGLRKRRCQIASPPMQFDPPHLSQPTNQPTDQFGCAPLLRATPSVQDWCLFLIHEWLFVSFARSNGQQKFAQPRCVPASSQQHLRCLCLVPPQQRGKGLGGSFLKAAISPQRSR